MSEPTYVSIESDGFTVSTNAESETALRENFGVEPVEPTEDAAEATDAKPAESAVADDAKPEAPKIDKRTREGRKASIQAEIDDLTATKHTTKRELEQAQAELARLRTELAAPKPEATKPATDAPAEPTPDQFDTYEKFVKAQAKWEAKQEIAAALAEQRKAWETQQAAAADRARGESWQTRLTEYRTAHPDFDTRLKPDTPITAPMRDVITDSPVGPELLLHLSEHPADAQRLSTLHPIQVIRELGKLEARLEAAHSGPAPQASVSAAKPPIKPVGSSAPVVDAEYSEDESLDAFAQRENAKERAARRRG